MDKIDSKLLSNAQYKKSLSISFFNSLNAAIEIIKCRYSEMPEKDVKEKIAEWRDWFISEHAKYYEENILNIGVYNSKDSIEKLNATTSLEELTNVWMSFSEDERRDGDIIKLKNELKLKYEKT